MTAARAGPVLRSPRGGYMAALTAASASSAELIRGTMTPVAPASRHHPMVDGSFAGTRTSARGECGWTAWSIGVRSLRLKSPCCMSMQT